MPAQASKRSAYYATWSRDEIDRRIATLWTKITDSKDGKTRAELRAEVDRLLEARHRRWPESAC